ncbi:hypothetical protein ACFL6C_07920 [Myxococcota bacterium]
MARSISCAVLLLLAAADAQAVEFGAGFRLGDPSGLTGKVFLTREHAIQFGVGFHPGYPGHGDPAYLPGPVLTIDWVYLIKRFGPASRKVWFGIHLGAGCALDFVAGDCYHDLLGKRACGTGILARMPVGLGLYIAKVRLEIFVEVVPAVRLLPSLAPALYLSGGARYFF